jgi:mono/diheme cytochrome c family protein
MKRFVTMACICAAAAAIPAGPAAADDVARGKELYNGIGACVSCHGAAGEGDGLAAAALNPKPRSFSEGKFLYDTDGDGKAGTDADLLNILQNGAAKYRGSPLMVGRPDISEADHKALIAFVRSLKQ